MKTLPSVSTDRQAIIKRLIVLNICKEALSLGIKLKNIPEDPRSCGRIMSDMLDKICPDMEKQVQYCTIQSVAKYRTIVDGTHATLCPWAIQILPLKDSPFPMTKLIRTAIPLNSSRRYEGMVVGGVVGEFAKIHGFSVICRTTLKGDTKFIAGSEVESVLEELGNANPAVYAHQEDTPTVERELNVLKANMVSPLAFIRCIRMIYKILESSIDTANSFGKVIEATKAEMVKVIERKEKRTIDVSNDGTVPSTPPSPIQTTSTASTSNISFVPRLISRGERISIRRVNAEQNTAEAIF